MKKLDPRLLAGDLAHDVEQLLKDVDKVLDAADPSKLLGSVIDDVFGHARSIVQELYPDDLFGALLGALDQLHQGFDHAVDRVEQSFEDMLGAVPAGVG